MENELLGDEIVAKLKTQCTGTVPLLSTPKINAKSGYSFIYFLGTKCVLFRYMGRILELRHTICRCSVSNRNRFVIIEVTSSKTVRNTVENVLIV